MRSDGWFSRTANFLNWHDAACSGGGFGEVGGDGVAGSPTIF